MKIIQLKISDTVYDKFILLLSKFSKEEIEIINKNEDVNATKNYLQDERSEIEIGSTSLVSEEILENQLNEIVMNKNQKDWWTEMTKEEQEEVKTGLNQANKGDFSTSKKVMKRFDKWH